MHHSSVHLLSSSTVSMPHQAARAQHHGVHRSPRQCSSHASAGNIYDRAKDGTECRWARVLAYEPPNRLLFSWDINGRWQIETDPEKTSEVEVRFIAESAERTRVELEHRNLDRHGDGWEGVREGVASGAAGRVPAPVRRAPGGLIARSRGAARGPPLMRLRAPLVRARALVALVSNSRVRAFLRAALAVARDGSAPLMRAKYQRACVTAPDISRSDLSALLSSESACACAIARLAGGAYPFTPRGNSRVRRGRARRGHDDSSCSLMRATSRVSPARSCASSAMFC